MVKLGHPHPLSNFLREANSGSPRDDVDVDAGLLLVPELVVEGRLGGGLLGHGVLPRGQLADGLWVLAVTIGHLNSFATFWWLFLLLFNVDFPPFVSAAPAFCPRPSRGPDRVRHAAPGGTVSREARGSDLGFRAAPAARAASPS